jgi:hypothetical protein
MAIWLEFYNIIMPISIIEKKYLGGFDAFKSSRKEMFAPEENTFPYLWHDDYLCRVAGAMNTEDIDFHLEELQKEMDLQVLGTVNGKTQFNDLYITGAYQGASYDCDWIDDGFKTINWREHPLTGEPDSIPVDFAFLKGTEPGLISPLESESDNDK